MSDESGSSSVEFLVIGLVLLIPTAYLGITLAVIQSADAAARAAAVGAARTAARSNDQAAAYEWARSTLSERGIADASAVVDLSCAPERCTWPDGIVTAQVTVSVPLPGVPAFPGLPTVTRVEASSAFPVARFGGNAGRNG